MRFKVVSYNIHKGLKPGNRRSVLTSMCEALRVQAPDIVLLQEVVDEHARYAARVPNWSGEPQARFIARGLRHAGTYAQNAVHANGGHGNAVLSQFRVGRSRKIEMSVNRWEQRGLLHTTVRLPDETRVHVACVHLNLLSRHRKQQVRRLCRFVTSELPDDSPLIIGGDFNDWRGTATETLADSLGMREVMLVSRSTLVPTFPAWRPVLALDRIYIRNLKVESAQVLDGAPWSRLSDHLPVAAVLSTNTAGTPDRAAA